MNWTDDMKITEFNEKGHITREVNHNIGLRISTEIHTAAAQHSLIAVNLYHQNRAPLRNECEKLCEILADCNRWEGWWKL